MTKDQAFWFSMGALASMLTFLGYLLFGPSRANVLDTPVFPDDHNIEVWEDDHDHY